jgi:para-nitrobenzyl esterase
VKRTVLFIAVILVVLGLGCQLQRCRSGTEPTPVRVDSATLRLTNGGRIVGFTEGNGTHAWLGIPFARAPVGELRWKAALPADEWEGTREALRTGSVCTQIGGLLGGVPKEQHGKAIGSEDCLFLNVRAPAFAPDGIPQGEDRLPVMLWIHGGGNTIGHGGNYDGKTFVAEHRVVFITINYRLGPLGWFSHPAFRGTGTTPEDRSGNYGTLDVIRALTWVRDNISAFGGDPGNVTVFGESAGARNTVTMLLSPKARGLLHRAAVQSGGSTTITRARAENYRDAPEPGHAYSSRETINQLLIADGIAADRAAAKIRQDEMSDREIAAYLRSKGSYDILGVYEPRTGGMLSVPQLFRDGVVLPGESALDVFRDVSRYNAVPVILGTNRDEHKLFMVRDPEYVDIYFGLYMRMKDPELYELVAGYRTDIRKATGVDRLAAVLSESQGPSVYAYRFDWDEEPSILGMDMSAFLGAAHGVEIPFVFDNFASGFLARYLNSDQNLPGREALADSMSSYWAEFAYGGAPGRGRDGKQRVWRPWNNSPGRGDKFIIFDTPSDGGIRMSSDTIGLAEVRARLLAETDLGNQQEHCQMYVIALSDSELWDDEEYASLGREGCGGYPKQTYMR